MNAVEIKAEKAVTASLEMKENNKRYKSNTIELQEEKDQLEDRNLEYQSLIKELEQKNRQLKETREQLSQTEKIAALGEITSRIAHEILNPITAALMRIEYNIAKEDKTAGLMTLLQDIISGWKKKYKQKQLEKYLNSRGKRSGRMGNQDFRLLYQSIIKIKQEEKIRKEDLSFLYLQLVRIVKIVNNLRTLTRKTHVIEKFRITRPVKESLDLMRDTIKKRHIDIMEKYPSDPPKVKADMNELIQVFSNIIKNSIQAIDELKGSRKGVIKIQIKKSLKQVKIIISDNGIGILPEYQQNIFKHSFTTKNRQEGTGMGLSISRTLIRENNGNIELITSSPQKGSAFMVSLPVYKEGGKQKIGSEI